MEQDRRLQLIRKYSDLPYSRLESLKKKTNQDLEKHKRQEHRGCFDNTCRRCCSLDELFKLQSQVIGGRKNNRQN